MRASCCFKEASCKKVEISNHYPPGKTDKALLDTMTPPATSFSLRFSGCFLTLLIWAGCSTADGLVHEHLAMQPTSIPGRSSYVTTAANTTYGESTLPFACGNNSHACMEICTICHSFFGNPTMECLSLLFSTCLTPFEGGMKALNFSDWCIWGNVRGLYSNLSACTERLSDCLMIPWPNPLVEQTFVNIHTKFFKDCPSEELSDPPPAIVFTLVIIPICLIPVMVSLVVLKTKNGDGSA